jgi:outer membrane receptor for ferrienterochelin and colicins
MRKALAISASAVAFVSGPANGAESKPDVSPASSSEENRASWSPTSTWRPVGPSAYDENQTLAELLNMSATVATKSSSSVSRSPGIVTVYGEKDIRRLGYYTIADLADITAGYSSYSIYGEKVLETRGQKAGSFVNNKHLVLIDGIPVNHGRGNKAMIDESFPLFFANRVEFLKGPASALYGTGAFFGVVNIAPKELEERGFRAEWRAGLGSNEGEKRVAANGMYRDGVRHAAIYAGFYDKGPSMELTGTMNNPDNRLWDNQRSVFLYLTYGVDAGPLAGTKAGFIYASKNGGLGEFWLAGYSPPYDDLTWVQMIPYVKYERALGHSFRFDGYVKASRDIEQATAAMGQARSAGTGNLALLYRFGVTTYEGLAEIRWEPSEIVNIIGGVDVNVSYQYDGGGSYGGKISGDPGPVFRVTPGTLTSHDVFQTYSPFLQLQQTLPVLTALHVTAGARLDTGKAKDVRFAQLSPRLGLVQELTSYLSLKALFGTALRAPGSKEFGLNSEAFGDLTDDAKIQAAQTRLQPEIIRSLEGAVSLNTTHVSANLVVFVNETHSALNERPEEGKNGRVNFFTNSSSKIVARGTEFEVTLAATPDARIFANYAVAKAELQSGIISPADQLREQSQLYDVPIHKVNAGASYRVDKPIDVTGSVVGKWVKGYRGARPIDPWINPPAVPSLDEAMRVGDHFVLDANFEWRASEHTSLELMVRNVLNEFYKVPQGGVPYVPMPRRSIHVTLDYRW